ncbi:MAG: hypothetical protein ABI679_15475 [Gemmatimonadota bacterium]
MTPEHDEVRYPLNSVLGVLDTADEASCAVSALTGPFLDTEIKAMCGQKEAERLRSGTGRTGCLVGHAQEFESGLVAGQSCLQAS